MKKHQLTLFAAAITAACQIFALNQAHADEADAKYRAALAFKKEGKLDDALKLVKEAIALRKDYATAYFTMGSILRQQGKFQEALNAFRQTTTYQADYGPAFAMQGAMLLRLDKPADAIKPLEQAIAWEQAHPKDRDPTVMSNLALALKKSGRNEEAIRIYKDALVKSPEDAMLHNNLGVAYRNSKQYDLAEKHLTKAADKDPNNFEFQLNLASTLRAQKKFDKAVVYYKRAFAINPNPPEPGAIFDMGFCYEEIKQPDEARAAYERYIEALGNKDPKGADLAQQRLNFLNKNANATRRVKAHKK